MLMEGIYIDAHYICNNNNIDIKIYVQYVDNFVFSAFACTSTSTQYIRRSNDVSIQFQAKKVHSQNSALIVTNQILSNNDVAIFSVLYQNGAVIRTTACINCTFTGSVSGDLSITLDNIQTSQGGVYKHSVVETNIEVKGCVLVYVLGKINKIINKTL